MPPDLIKDLAKIIERDSKFATYKFALLRGTIEIIQEQDHYKSIDLETMISYPMGLLILKWIEYYYPILNNAAIKDRILHYWENLWKVFPEQFETEVQVSLLGKTAFNEKNWKNDTYNQLSSMCNYMIEERGFDPWTNI